MKKNEKILEVVRYLIVGLLTTLVSLAIYYGLVYTVLNPENALQLQIANILSWIGSVTFAYITNRTVVFRSNSKNKIKEATKFLGSRLVTLVLDMGIMFTGVTILSYNDKMIKILSQVIVIISNYVLSKLFVFKTSSSKKNYDNYKYKIVRFGIFLLPIFLIVLETHPSRQIDFLFTLFLTIFFLFFGLSMLQKKQNIGIVLALLTYVIIEICYFYCKDADMLTSINQLIAIFLLPMAGFYFKNNKVFNERFWPILFFETCFLTFLFLEDGTILLPILVITLPFAVVALKNHSNYLIRFLGLFFLSATIILYHFEFLALEFLVIVFYLFWKDRKMILKERGILVALLLLALTTCVFNFRALTIHLIHQDITIQEVVLGKRLKKMEQETEYFFRMNPEEQIFGATTLPDVAFQKVGIDFLDIWYFIGTLGIIVYCLFFIILSYQAYAIGYQRFALLAALVFSCFHGGVLMNACTILLGSLVISIEQKSRILLVANMYPSKKYKHYGVFIKNTKELLENLDFQVDIVVKKKQDNKVLKVFSYAIFYTKAFLKSFFFRYDFLYAHFISHSVYPLIPAKWMSPNLPLISHAHGNDIVADSIQDEKNIHRSSIACSYSDLLIVPSLYFKEILIKDYSVREDKIIIIPSGGVDLVQFCKKDRKSCLKKLDLPDVPYLGCVTRLEKDKGWDTVLKAISKLKEPIKWKQLVIGTGSEQSDFNHLVEELGLQDKIIQKDFVTQKDLVDYLNILDAIIVPTRRKSESLGLIGLEAMACETLVIGCNLYGPKTYLTKKNSLLFRTEKELVDDLNELNAMDEKTKKRYTDNALETAKEYDSKKVQDNLAKVFSKEGSIT